MSIAELPGISMWYDERGQGDGSHDRNALRHSMIFDSSTLEIFYRLLIALGIGGVIGIERSCSASGMASGAVVRSPSQSSVAMTFATESAVDTRSA